MSNQTPRRSFFTGYWIPLTIVVIGLIAQIVNWSMVLIPKFGNSAQVVIGRNLYMLVAGLLLIWLLFTRQVSRQLKYSVFGLVAVAVGLGYLAIRDIENTGNNNYVFHFRWEKTQDERLAELKAKPVSIPVNKELDANAPKLTDFLGPKRDGIVPGPRLASDLAKNAPQELWRRPVGGGYAACVLSGGIAVTIEQREDEEVVVAYDLATGNERWTKGYPGHFRESLGGNGPRATPTIADNEVFALGASGVLVALDLATGTQKWQTNILKDASADNIQWGMCGAPLVTVDKVIVNPGGTESHGLVAYDRKTGKPAWSGGSSKAAYATPVLATLLGQEMVLIFDAAGAAGHDVQTGKELWRFPFSTANGINVAQPLALPGDQVFVSAGYDAGAVLLQIKKEGATWSATPLWQNKRLKCKMSSAIYYDGYLYGMDDGVMACLDAKTGDRKWKGGRYGHSQMLLRNNIFVIMGESGDLIFVAADPKTHRELGKLAVLPGGKAWNAPALAGNMLLLRNHFEAVLLKLATE